MPVQTQTLSIALAKGLDTKSDPKQVIPASMLQLQNAIFTSPNRIQKRNGYVALPSLSYGVALSPFQSELVELDSLNLWTYSEAESQWYNKGIKQTCSVYQQNVFTSVNNTYLPFLQVNGNTSIYTTGSQVSLANSFFSIIDNITQLPIFSSVQLATGVTSASYVIPVPVASSYGVFYLDKVNQYLSCITINPATAAQSSPTNLTSADATGTYLDVCQNSSGSVTYAAYKALGINGLTIAAVNTATTTVSLAAVVNTGVILSSSFPSVSLSYDATNNYVWVFYAANGVVKYLIYNSTLTTQILGPTVVQAYSTGLDSLGSIVVGGVGTTFFSLQNNSPALSTYQDTIYSAVCTTTGTVASSILLSSGVVASKPFLVTPAAGSTAYIHFVVGYPSPEQRVGFILRYLGPSSYQVVAKIAPGNFSAQNITQGGSLPQVVFNSTTGNYNFPYLQAVLASELTNGSNPQNNEVIGIFDFNTKPQGVQLANNLNYSGGFVSSYDGSTNFENNFFLFPENVTGTTTTTGGTLPQGIYGIQVTYEWTDSYGQMQRSAPSTSISVTTGSGSTNLITVKIPWLYMTNKTFNSTSQVNIVIYSTTANGSIYYKTGIIPNNPAAYGSYGDVFLSTGAGATSAQTGNEQLYTTGGEVPNGSAPASDIMCSYDNRLILVPSEQPLSWWYSKQVINDFPVEFSPVFVNNIDQRGGAITAVAAMDAEIVFFKENVIFYVTGQGPSPNGANSDFTYPQIITTDVGCVDRDSVVLTPAGLMFKSAKGIYLLDRSLTTSYIGAGVEQFNNIHVVSAQLTPGTTQVRFALADGTALVYDYYVNQWSEFLNINAVDTCIYNNNYCTLSVAGLPQEETAGVFTDNGTAIPMLMNLGRIQVGQVQGFERVKQLLILGEAISPTNLTVQFTYDFSPVVNQTTTIPIIAASSPMQYRVFLNRQKCESVRITISDAPQSPYGAGINLSNLALEVGVKKGPNKMPASSTYA
jgi:hypothetical protein